MAKVFKTTAELYQIRHETFEVGETFSLSAVKIRSEFLLIQITGTSVSTCLSVAAIQKNFYLG